MASSTGFVKKSPVVTPQAMAAKQLTLSNSSERPSVGGDKIQPASSSGDKPVSVGGNRAVVSKVKVEEEEEERKLEAAITAPLVVVEDTATPTEGSAESADRDAASSQLGASSKSDALSVMKKTDAKPKSRSGSPANVASPAAAAVAMAAAMKSTTSTSSLVSEVQPSTFTAASSLQGMPGMLSGKYNHIHGCALIRIWRNIRGSVL